MQISHRWYVSAGVALVGDPATIEDAFQTGLQNVGAAIVQFPESVFNDIVGAVQDVGTAAA
jgi:hypothetical protein